MIRTKKNVECVKHEKISRIGDQILLRTLKQLGPRIWLIMIRKWIRWRLGPEMIVSLMNIIRVKIREEYLRRGMKLQWSLKWIRWRLGPEMIVSLMNIISQNHLDRNSTKPRPNSSNGIATVAIFITNRWIKNRLNNSTKIGLKFVENVRLVLIFTEKEYFRRRKSIYYLKRRKVFKTEKSIPRVILCQNRK